MSIMGGLRIISVLLFMVATVTGFVYPGMERTLGEVQRLFYVHFGTFYGALLAFIIACLSGLAYLKTRHPRWDAVGLAAVEVGTWLCAATIVSGMFVARPVWGVFWTWDPRLTTVAMMWVTYFAYFFLRGSIEHPDQQRRFAAIYGVLAFASVILNMIVLQYGNNLTTPILLNWQSTLSPRIVHTIFLNIVAYSVISLTLILHRADLEAKRQQIIERRIALLQQLER